jgi:transglutaminase-like putative cysteine protease
MTHAHPRPYLDTSRIDWSCVTSATYEVRQTLCYEYPGPIEDVHQVLVVVPPDEISGQRLLAHEITVDPVALPRYDTDRFGNRVCYVKLPRIEHRLRFSITMHLERIAVPDSTVSDMGQRDMFLLPSPLTDPSSALREHVAQMQRDTRDAATLAERINRWVYEHVTYRQGVTDISTTAQDVFEQRQGVCQDYAHLMIALCRLPHDRALSAEQYPREIRLRPPARRGCYARLGPGARA